MKRIFFNEVVTRDGFQIEPEFISTSATLASVEMNSGSIWKLSLIHI